MSGQNDGGFEQRLNQGPEGDRADYMKGSGAGSDISDYHARQAQADKNADTTSTMIGIQTQAGDVVGEMVRDRQNQSNP